MIEVVRLKKSDMPYGGIEEITKEIKGAHFKNRDYMMGFLDGYLFKKYSMLTLEKFQVQLNGVHDKIDDWYYIFVEYGYNDEEEEA